MKLAFIDPTPTNIPNLTGDIAPFGALCLASYLKHYRPDVESRIYTYSKEGYKEALEWGDAFAVSAFDHLFLNAFNFMKRANGKPMIIGGHTVSQGEGWVREVCRDIPNLSYCTGLGEDALVQWLDGNCETQEASFLSRHGTVYGNFQLSTEFYARRHPKCFYQAVLHSRGCPFVCSFCQRISNQVREPELIVEESEKAVVDKHYRRIDFISGTTFIKSPHMIKLAELWRKSKILEGVKVSGTGKFGPSTLRKEVYEPWEGLIDYIFLSVEGGNNKMLKEMMKSFTVEDIYEGLERIETFGVRKLFLSSITGFPFENADDVKDLRKMMDYVERRVKRFADYTLQLNVLTPYFGSEVCKTYPCPRYNPFTASDPPADLVHDGNVFWYDLEASHREEIVKYVREFNRRN